MAAADSSAREGLKRDLLIRGRSDVLQFAEMYGAAQDCARGFHSADDLRVLVVDVVGDLVKRGFALVGTVRRDDTDGLLTVVPWRGDHACFREYLMNEFVELRDPPDLGGTLWLMLTDEGRQAAAALES